MSLDAACFGQRPESFEDVMRQRAAEVWRGKYGEPSGALIHVPHYAQYAAGDRITAKIAGQPDRRGVVLRADHELGLIEVTYAK